MNTLGVPGQYKGAQYLIRRHYKIEDWRQKSNEEFESYLNIEHQILNLVCSWGINNPDVKKREHALQLLRKYLPLSDEGREQFLVAQKLADAVEYLD